MIPKSMKRSQSLDFAEEDGIAVPSVAIVMIIVRLLMINYNQAILTSYDRNIKPTSSHRASSKHINPAHPFPHPPTPIKRCDKNHPF
jgi:hypothetical protein